MLTALTLEGFKAFGDEARIELAPITLIYGENSAGKTTILQSLSLLKQTLESRKRETGTALLPKAEEGLVDLGSFRELLFDHDLSRSLRIGLSLRPSDDSQSPLFPRRSRFGVDAFEMDFTFGQDKPSSDVRLKQLRLAFDENRAPSMEYGTRRLNKQDISQFRYWFRPRARRVEERGNRYAAQCTSISQNEDHWRELFEPWHSSRTTVAEILHRQITAVRQRRSRNEKHSADEDEFSAQIAQAIEFYESSFTLQQFIDRVSTASYKQLSFVDAFIPRGSPEPEGLPECDVAFMRSHKVHHLPSLAFTESLTVAGFQVEEALNAVFPLGPFRRPPERWYMFTGTSPVDVGYQGDHLPDLLLKQPTLRKRANDWLERLQIGYSLRVRRIGGAQSDLFAVRLEDTQRKKTVDVALSDVGFGISQILPFVVQCLASKERIISIEQPEVHIHPRLQADLGDLIAETAHKPYGHQFLVETHSEHLVLRLQKLIRSGSLRSEDVSVIYVSRGKEGSTAQRLQLDDSGDFVDEWPGGFFPERMREFR